MTEEGRPMVESMSPVTLPVMLQGRYRMGPVIGRGGASVVYRASDLLLGREVAVKVFSTRAIDSAALREQEGEARILAGFNHPGLVTLLDAGVDLTDPAAPQVFLVMELVPTADLRERLRHGALDALEVAYLGWDLLDALGYVHERGIIHRDLKPANVLLVEARDRPARGKLADFGIAVLRGAIADADGETTTGTAAYLSPEQVEGGPLTPASDIYSLGLVLLEAYSGRVVFPGGVLESAFARLDQAPVMPPEMPSDLADALRSMTAKDPSARPSAQEALAAFRSLIIARVGGERPQAHDPEADRLAAVRDLNLIGTPPDAEFDRITALAARLFEVPMAVISIVDEDRVWLKSRRGIDVAEVDRARGLGASGGLQERTLVIEDMATDPRTANLPDTGSTPFRFYAGVPLITRDGHNIGTLAVADITPRPMSASEVATLEDLAAMALHEMELRRAARRAALGQLRVPGSDGR